MSDRRETREEPTSRSEKKRAAKAVEELARQAVDLPEAHWRKLPPMEIREEIGKAREIRSFGARDRQMRHVASLLRRHPEDLSILEGFLEEVHQGHSREVQDFRRLEKLRERLCNPGLFPDALAELEKSFPGVDFNRLKKLSIACHSGDKIAFREIFRLLRDALRNAES